VGGNYTLPLMNNVLATCLCFFFNNFSATLPVIQTVSVTGETNTVVAPTSVIAVTTTATGIGMSQQPQGGSDDITAVMGQGLFTNRTEDSDDDYDV